MAGNLPKSAPKTAPILAMIIAKFGERSLNYFSSFSTFRTISYYFTLFRTISHYSALFRVGKICFFYILTSKKYGVNDPSGISHFCLSSKFKGCRTCLMDSHVEGCAEHIHGTEVAFLGVLSPAAPCVRCALTMTRSAEAPNSCVSRHK